MLRFRIEGTIGEGNIIGLFSDNESSSLFEIIERSDMINITDLY